MKVFLRFLLCAVLIGVVSCKKDEDTGNNDANSNKLAVGSSAHDFLSAEKYTSLQIEILYSPGFEPPAAALNYLEDFVTTYCHKPEGISFITRQLDEAPQEGYTLADIRNIEDQNRTVFNTGSSLGVYVFFAGGDYVENSDTLFTLGLAYRNTSNVIFQKTIKSNIGGIGSPTEATVTSSIIGHEIGHLLGLVDLGSDMVTDHEDGENESHCDNEDCLMYWALNSSNAMGLFGGNVAELDANCVADLKANGGK